jgi:paraquat-inducible protein B
VNERRQRSSPRWLVPLIVVALTAGPLILYNALPHAGVPAWVRISDKHTVEC